MEQFYIALKTYIPGIYGLPEAVKDGPSLGEELALRKAGNALYSLLSAMRFKIDLQDGRSFTPSEFLDLKDNPEVEGLKPAELPIACSWFKMPDLHGAMAFYSAEGGTYTSDFFLASHHEILSVPHLAEDWLQNRFNNGEALQDFIVDKDLFSGDYMLNFKAGILSAHLFAKLLDQLPMDKKS